MEQDKQRGMGVASLIEQQKKENKTIKERTIVLHLSTADCKNLVDLCGENNVTVSKLLEQFIKDFVGGIYSNGMEERYLIQQWFHQCSLKEAFSIITPAIRGSKTLLTWLLEKGKVDDFFDLIEDLEHYQEEFILYQTEFLKEKPNADWEKEIANARKWFIEKEKLLNFIDSRNRELTDQIHRSDEL